MQCPSEPTKSTLDAWDRLLRKYVHVWLWSILFGSTTGVGTTFVVLSLREGRWGPLWPIVLVGALGGFVAVVNAWWYLYLFLVRVLLPQLFGQSPKEAQSLSSETLDEFPERSGWYLSRAFLCLFAAITIGAVTLVMRFAFEALQ